MNLTFTQAVERTKDLSGEIKAARAHEADCAADHEAKKRIAEIAGEAHNKASAHCIELEEERERLADHMAALVRKTGEPQGAAPDFEAARDGFAGAMNDGSLIRETEAAFNSVFADPAEDHAQVMLNHAADKVGLAWDEATR